MTLFKYILLGILSCVSAQSDTVCPKDWVSGSNKCFKLLIKRYKLREAADACKLIGGSIFMPDSVTEFTSIKTMADELGLKYDVHNFWLFLKLEDIRDTKFPPALVQVNNKPAPDWINEQTATNYYGNIGKTSLNRFIRTGKNRRAKLQFLKSVSGKLLLTKPGSKSFRATALCEMKKPKLAIGDPKYCWQPQSDFYNSVEYSGHQTGTNMGFTCADWDDESVHAHKVKPTQPSKNYCRNPDGGADGPWCYINDGGEMTWDTCPIDKCAKVKNEFVDKQSNCGVRPLFNAARIINGRDALYGEVPYQARIRYYQQMNFGATKSDHQCGATLISSCWLLTAAHCIPPDGWFNDKGGGEFWFRVDVGNRGYQSHAADLAACDPSHPDYAKSKTDIRCEDRLSHQTLRVRNIFIHKQYRQNDNDLALIQLWPTDPNGECAILGDTVQHACLNNDPSRFKTGATCLISGWGDVNKNDPHIQHPDQLQIAEIQVADFTQCRSSYIRVKKKLNNKRHMCAKGEGVDSCQGDSGGPLVCLDKNEGEASDRAFLTGVVSFGASCAEAKYPGVYVPTSSYYNWIAQTVDDNPQPAFDPMMVCSDPQCK